MTTTHPRSPQSPTPRRPRLGLPVWTIAALALLGAPRVVLHDLGVVSEGTGVNLLLVVAPPIIWIAVVLIKRVRQPFLALLVTGAAYGVVLAITHQVLWNTSFGGDAPTLGGNLADLDATVQAIIIRTFAIVSSIFTGVVVGAITGLVAWGLRAVIGYRGR